MQVAGSPESTGSVGLIKPREMPPNRPLLTMSDIKMLGELRYPAKRLSHAVWQIFCNLCAAGLGHGGPPSITSLAAGQTYHVQGLYDPADQRQRHLYQRSVRRRHDRDGRQEQAWRRTSPRRCPAVLIRRGISKRNIALEFGIGCATRMLVSEIPRHPSLTLCWLRNYTSDSEKF